MIQYNWVVVILLIMPIIYIVLEYIISVNVLKLAKKLQLSKLALEFSILRSFTSALKIYSAYVKYLLNADRKQVSTGIFYILLILFRLVQQSRILLSEILTAFCGYLDFQYNPLIIKSFSAANI